MTHSAINHCAIDILDEFDQQYHLGDVEMDQTHREFLSAAYQAGNATGSEFGRLFKQLFEHTQTHFAAEEARMQAIGHALLGEHRADHQRILGDMARFCERIAAGRSTMAKAWLNDSLMQWFKTHAKTMDSALASDLKKAVHSQQK